MKSFLKVILSALAFGVLASAPILKAQDDAPKKGKGGRGGMQMSPEEQVAGIEKAVGTLTEDQKTKIKDIVAKTREQMQGLSQEDRRTKGRELMMAQHDQIRSVLTADQQKKFDDMPQPGKGGGGRKKKDN
jgi:Spy/CpxP family protein refolding chaperone